MNLPLLSASVLLVTRDGTLMQQLPPACESLGMTVMAADSVEVALALAQFQPASWLLFDLAAGAPAMVGLVEHLRAQPVMAEMRVVVLSDSHDVVPDLPVDDILVKPLMASLIARRLQSLVALAEREQLLMQRLKLLEVAQAMAGVAAFEWMARSTQIQVSDNFSTLLNLPSSAHIGLDGLRRAFRSSDALAVAHLLEAARRTGQLQSVLVHTVDGRPCRLQLLAGSRDGEALIHGTITDLSVLPAGVEASVVQLPVAQAVPSGSRKILVVDDSRVSRMLLKSFIQAKLPQYDVIEEGNALAVLDVVAQEHPCLVTMDINMPERSGLDVAADLRQRYPSLDIVVVSANFQESNLARARAMNLRFLRKPITEQLVADLLQGLKLS